MLSHEKSELPVTTVFLEKKEERYRRLVDNTGGGRTGDAGVSVSACVGVAISGDTSFSVWLRAGCDDGSR